MPKIVLTTLNSRYSHTSIALRYLYANLKELKKESKILEFVINGDAQSIAEKILDEEPKIVGFGVYIWNVLDIKKIIKIIKKVSFDTKIILGGPEVSHFPLRVNFDEADYIIQGEAEISFYKLCGEILNGDLPKNRIIQAVLPDVKKIQMPYPYYSKSDIQNRKIYVEASRGCPFRCEFCLSSLDERVRYFDMEKLLEAFEILWQKGVRNFKFIDRTFNLNIEIANRLIDFFLSKKDDFSLHFEVIPDSFPDTLKKRIKQFPPSSLQLEIGIQTLNENIAKNINRRLNIEKIEKNIRFLEQSNVHMHLDLIVGLPGEDLKSFADNLNRLVCMTRSEIQIGILKKLSGTTINRHDIKYAMIYNSEPPYDILQNAFISFKEMQKMKRFARFWDLTYNSGNFYHTIPIMWEDDKDVFKNFYDFSQWLYNQSESTWHISLNRLSEFVFGYLTEVLGKEPSRIADSIIKDIIRINGRSIPEYLRKYATKIPDLRKTTIQKHNKRQILHSL